MTTRKNTYGRGGLWVAVVAGFALAILDMFFLKGVFEPFFGDIGGAFIAFALAIGADFSALFWGKEVGAGKKGRSFFWGWVVMGFVYFIIRAYGTSMEIANNGATVQNIMLQVTYFIVLTISYIGSGTLIKWAAEQLWDKDITNYLHSKKEFEELNSDLANNRAAILSLVRLFENYGDNFKELEDQYEKRRKIIREFERSTMNQIVEKTIVQYGVDPIDARKVMERVLAERDQKNEREHQKAL